MQHKVNVMESQGSPTTPSTALSVVPAVRLLKALLLSCKRACLDASYLDLLIKDLKL
jgi:hypothetical protein